MNPYEYKPIEKNPLSELNRLKAECTVHEFETVVLRLINQHHEACKALKLLMEEFSYSEKETKVFNGIIELNIPRTEWKIVN